MRIPFVGPEYRSRSVNQSAQRLVNWYLERSERGGRTQFALYPTPGLRLLATVGDGPIRAIDTFGDAVYVVSGSELYRVSANWTATKLGDLKTSSGPVGMAYNALQVLLVDGETGYVLTISDNSFAEITDEDFPDGVTWARYLDGYFVVGGDGSGRFYISDILNGSSWVGTEFASAEGDPDPCVMSIVDHRELWLIGTQTIEIWVNTGNPDFPIERQGNAFIEKGTPAAASVVKLDNSIFWLGQDEGGEGVVWRADAYNPVRVSTHGIEYLIGQCTRVDDAVAYAYTQEGHAFYVLTFPTDDLTIVYDVASGEWHERAWFDVVRGIYRRHRAQCHTVLGRTHVVGDWQNGKIYALDLDTFTDDGVPIRRLRSTIGDDNEMRNIVYHQLQIDIESGVGLVTGQGSDPLMMLRWSNDGGHTWSNTHTASMGKIGEYGRRCLWNRLGMGRQRVWEISITDPVKAVIMGAVMRATPGAA